MIQNWPGQLIWHFGGCQNLIHQFPRPQAAEPTMPNNAENFALFTA